LPSHGPLSWCDSFYFSLLVATTFGFGDVQPLFGETWTKLIILSEIFVGVVFVVIVLGFAVSVLAQEPAGRNIQKSTPKKPDGSRSKSLFGRLWNVIWRARKRFLSLVVLLISTLVVLYLLPYSLLIVLILILYGLSFLPFCPP
jgi:hypothetical protein